MIDCGGFLRTPWINSIFCTVWLIMSYSRQREGRGLPATLSKDCLCSAGRDGSIIEPHLHPHWKFIDFFIICRLIGSFFAFDQPLPCANKYTVYTSKVIECDEASPFIISIIYLSSVLFFIGALSSYDADNVSHRSSWTMDRAALILCLRCSCAWYMQIRLATLCKVRPFALLFDVYTISFYSQQQKVNSHN